MAQVFLDEIESLKLSEQDQTERCIAEYFLRRGWYVERIDEDERKRPDFFISFNDTQLLCEVKTISSSHRGDHPEDTFDKDFRNPVLNYFQRQSFHNLSYSVVIDSDTMTAPSKEESSQFSQWLGESLISIHQGAIPYDWKCINYNLGTFYLSEYKFLSNRPNNTPNSLHIHISPKQFASHLDVFIPSYGGINTGPLRDRIKKAVTQLDDEANYRNKLLIPRIVAIALRGGLGLDFSTTINCLYTLLCSYKQLSAIAILNWIPETASLSTRWFLGWIILHNQQGTNLLPGSVFDDGYSKQHYDLVALISTMKSAGL